MITIREISPALKASGLSSFLVSFNYNQQIIQAIKTIPVHIYHKKLQIWQIPAIYIAQCLDTLTKLDDINLSLLPDDCFNQDSLPPLTQEEIRDFKANPFPHQIEAVNFMLRQNKSLLLDGCGVGKSLQMILYAQTLKKRGLIEHCLVITGIAGLRANWQREIAKFSNCDSIIIGKRVTKTGNIRYQSIPKRAQQLRNKIKQFFVIINIESLRDTKIIEAIKKSENIFGLIAFDEIHRCGASNTTQAKNLVKLDAPFKVGATGTLVINNPESCRMPLFWTGNDHATLTNFKAQYCQFGDFNQIIGYKNLSYLRQQIEQCSIRRTLFDVRKDIPPLTIDTEYLEMDEPQQKFYEAIKQGIKEQADKIELKANNLLALTTRLRQATACPNVLTTQNIDSIKVQRAFEYIQEVTSQGEKVVVFSVFKQPLHQLATKLAGFRFSLNTGDVDDATVMNNVTRFQEDPAEQVFLGSCSKMGVGYTLNSSMYLVFIDTPYTFALFEQCYQRVHRISNTRPAYIKVLVCNETIDERVQQILSTKKDLGEYLVDGKESSSLSIGLQDALRKIILQL